MAKGLALDTLSMGMSHDLEAAIMEGATIVRVGTAIFGERAIHMKITFIGGGNMAIALIGGMKKQGFSAAGIQVVEPVRGRRASGLTDTFGVRCTAAHRCRRAQLRSR